LHVTNGVALAIIGGLPPGSACSGIGAQKREFRGQCTELMQTRSEESKGQPIDFADTRYARVSIIRSWNCSEL
jgi:hypothetical protein